MKLKKPFDGWRGMGMRFKLCGFMWIHDLRVAGTAFETPVRDLLGCIGIGGDSASVTCF
jgi:hypothetical protein